MAAIFVIGILIAFGLSIMLYVNKSYIASNNLLVQMRKECQKEKEEETKEILDLKNEGYTFILDGRSISFDDDSVEKLLEGYHGIRDSANKIVTFVNKR